jgi:uncharacterized membrane protein
MEELLAMFMISGVILVAISIPLIKGRVAPNGLYGFRVRDTLDDPKTWYKTNRYSGKWLLATGLIFIAVCILAYNIPNISLDTYSLVCLAGFLIPMTIGVIMSWRYMKKLKENR